MLNWLKKWLVGSGINDLDRLIPVIAQEIDVAKRTVGGLDSMALATRIVKKLQDALRTYFGIAAAAALLLCCMAGSAHAWNPITDIRENTIWTFGKAAEVGQAIKVGGGGDLKNGDTTTSVLASIAQYHCLAFSYGGTRANRNDANFTDTAKIGLRITSFLDWFKNPPTPEMQFLRNLNIGPSYTMPLFTAPHTGTLFIDVNYQFGGSAASQP